MINHAPLPRWEGTCAMPLHFARLDPEHVLPTWRARHRTGDRWICFRTTGLAPSHGYPADNVVWAGFDNWDDGGTFCRESMDYVFRGGVQRKPGPDGICCCERRSNFFTRNLTTAAKRTCISQTATGLVVLWTSTLYRPRVRRQIKSTRSPPS